MTDDDLFDEAELRYQVSVLFGPTSDNIEWLCDVKEALSDTIISFNEALRSEGRDAENKFMKVGSKPSTLVSLLKSDYEFLSTGPNRPYLRHIASNVRFFEVDKASPNAGITVIETKRQRYFAVTFNSALISFINAAFSKVFILTHDHVHAGCLEMHEKAMEGAEYTDTQLFLGLLMDIEDLFVNEEPYIPIYPLHLADPYDYCEWVEGARRFILGHEISHLFHGLLIFDNIEVDLSFIASLPPEDKQNWERELWCDALALNFIMNRSEEPVLSGTDLYEMENSLVGIITYLTLLELVECSLMNFFPKTHPPAWVRREFLRERIKQHKIYTENTSMPKVLSRNWGKLNRLRAFAGGTKKQQRFHEIWSREDFQNCLTRFGHNAHKMVHFHSVAKRWNSGFDMGQFLRNEVVF